MWLLRQFQDDQSGNSVVSFSFGAFCISFLINSILKSHSSVSDLKITDQSLIGLLTNNVTYNSVLDDFLGHFGLDNGRFILPKSAK